MKDKHAARPTDEDIARKAYELFEARGRLPGHEREDWLAAEQQLQEEPKPKTGPKTAARPGRPRGQSARPKEI